MSRITTPLLLAFAVALQALLAGCGGEPQQAPVAPDAGLEQAESPAQDEAQTAEAEAATDGEAAGEDALSDATAQPAEPDAAETPGADAEPAGGVWAAIGGVLARAGSVLARLLFVLILPIAIAGTLFGLPGGVLVLADAVVFSACTGWATPPWWLLLVLAVIAVGAELAENALSFLGVKQSGAGTRTGLWTVVGGFVGAVVGGFISPIASGIGLLGGPVGWVILSIVPPIGLGMLGGFLGGYLFELQRGTDPEEARKTGWGALFGRLAGSFTKALLVAVMSTIVLISTWGALF